MYIDAGFSESNPIPTLCLFSKDDIKKAKEQLLQSTLSWKNLEEIRVAINSYITKIQPIDKTKEYPVAESIGCSNSNISNYCKSGKVYTHKATKKEYRMFFDDQLEY